MYLLFDGSTTFRFRFHFCARPFGGGGGSGDEHLDNRAALNPGTTHMRDIFNAYIMCVNVYLDGGGGGGGRRRRHGYGWIRAADLR